MHVGKSGPWNEFHMFRNNSSCQVAHASTNVKTANINHITYTGKDFSERQPEMGV